MINWFYGNLHKKVCKADVSSVSSSSESTQSLITFGNQVAI